MTRDVCGICMCTYDEDGCCGCKSFSLAWTLLQENKTLKSQNQELIETLRWLDRWMGGKPLIDCANKVRIAIKKATGETV